MSALGLCCALPGAAWAQAGGLKTSFEFQVRTMPLASGLASQDVSLAPLMVGVRSAPRVDFAQAWRGVALGGPGLSAPWQQAELLSGAGPLSFASVSLRPTLSDSWTSPLGFDPARYRLESGRVTLRAPVYEDGGWTLRLGATGVNGAVATGAGQMPPALRSGLGLAPMWHASADRRLDERWSLGGDLNLGMGRNALGDQPIDMALRAAYEWDRDWSLTGGYRLVDTRSGNLPGLTGLGGVNRIQTLTFGVRRSF